MFEITRKTTIQELLALAQDCTTVKIAIDANITTLRAIPPQISTIIVPHDISESRMLVIPDKNILRMDIILGTGENTKSMAFPIFEHTLKVNVLFQFKGTLVIKSPRREVVIVNTTYMNRPFSTAFIARGVGGNSVLKKISRKISRVIVGEGVDENVVRTIPLYVRKIDAHAKLDENIKTIIQALNEIIKAISEIKQGNYRAAIETASKAIQIDRRSIRAYEIRALGYANIGEIKYTFKDWKEINTIEYGNGITPPKIEYKLKHRLARRILKKHRQDTDQSLVLSKIKKYFNFEGARATLIDVGITVNVITQLRKNYYKDSLSLPNIFTSINTEVRKRWQDGEIPSIDNNQNLSDSDMDDESPAKRHKMAM